MTATSLPSLTAEQRELARAKSLATRRDQAHIKDVVGLGILGNAVVLAWALAQPEAQGMRVYTLLLALPRVGPKTAHTMMTKAEIPEGRRVRGLGSQQVKRLLEQL